MADAPLTPERIQTLAKHHIKVVGAGYIRPADVLAFARAMEAAARSADPVGWVTMWPSPRRPGHEPVYTHGAKKPSYGPELDAVLDVQPVYAAAQPQPQPAQPLTAPDERGRKRLTQAGHDVLRSAQLSGAEVVSRGRMVAPSTPTPPEVAP